MSAPVWLVTGAGSGVGRTLAVALAATGAEVILAGRNPDRLEQTSRWCWAPSVLAPVDLADPASVALLASTVRKQLAGRPLAGLVHAAGVMTWNSAAARNGISTVPLVNALSPWSLTNALEPELLAGGARVLFVAGAPFTLRGVLPQPDQWPGDRPGRGLALALEAASAKVVMARVLHRRWAGRASVFAFHPGFVKSRLADGLPIPLRLVGWAVQPFLASRSRTGEFLCLDPQAPGLSGLLVSGHRGVADVPFAPDPAREDALIQAFPVP